MPSSFSLKIEGLDKMQEDFNRAGVNYKPLMKQAMIKSTVQLKNKIQENLTTNRTSNTGSLRRAVQVREATDSRGVVGVGDETANYGAHIEFGTRPHFPPVAPIERWAQTKLGVKGAGFAIARKISKKGTKAQPFVQPAFVSEADYVLDQFIMAANHIIHMMGGR